MVRRAFALALALTLIGGHIAALQVVAWTGMLAARMGEDGWRAAVTTTFDGRHPCAMCLAVSRLSTDASATAAKTDTRKQADTPPRKPVDAVPAGPPVINPGAAVARLHLLPPAGLTALDPTAPEPPPPRRI